MNARRFGLAKVKCIFVVFAFVVSCAILLSLRNSNKIASECVDLHAETYVWHHQGFQTSVFQKEQQPNGLVNETLFGNVPLQANFLLRDLSGDCLDSRDLTFAVELLTVKKYETVVLAGDLVTLEHVKIVKSAGVKYLILDSCPPALCQSLSEVEDEEFKVLCSQRTIVEELRASPPGICITKKHIRSSFPRYLDDIHFHQVIELGRNRNLYPVFGKKVTLPIQLSLRKLSTLRALDLGATAIHAKLFDHLGQLSSLEFLSLDEVDFDSESLRKLNSKTLRYLNLARTKVKEPFGNMENLEVLVINNTMIDDSFFEQPFPKLKKLIVNDTELSEAGIRKLSLLPSLENATVDLIWKGQSCVGQLRERLIKVDFYSTPVGSKKSDEQK